MSKFNNRRNRMNTVDTANAGNKITNEMYTSYKAVITNEIIGDLYFSTDEVLRMNVNGLFRRKIDTVTKSVIGVGTVTIDSVIFRAMAREALELRAKGIEGTQEENKACEELLRTYLNAEIAENGYGSKVRYNSIFKYGRNQMLSKYAEGCNVLADQGSVYANLQMMLYKVGEQQSNMFNDQLMNMDLSCVTIKDIITIVMDAQHISRLVQETSIDMDKKHTLTIGFTLGQVLNKELKAASSILKSNIKRNKDGKIVRDENGEIVKVVTSNAYDVRHNKADEFSINIDLNEEVVKDEAVVTAYSIMEGDVESINENFMGIMASSRTTEMTVAACDFATANYNDAVEIASYLELYNSYMIATSAKVGEGFDSVEIETEDREEVVQAIKNSIIQILEVGGYTNEQKVKLVMGASCKTRVQVGNTTRIAFVATEEKEYARRLFREQVLFEYSRTNLDGTKKEATEIYSEPVNVIPTIALEDAFEEDNTLEFNVRFEGNKIIDIDTNKMIARSKDKLTGTGCIGMANGKVKAVKNIELTNEFVKVGDTLAAKMNMVNLNEALRIRYRSIKTKSVVAIEKEIAANIELINERMAGKEVWLINSYRKTADRFGDKPLTICMKDTNSKGELKMTDKQNGITCAIANLYKDMNNNVLIDAFASVELGNSSRLGIFYNLEQAMASHNTGKTDSSIITNAFVTADVNKKLIFDNIKYLNGNAIMLFKKTK